MTELAPDIRAALIVGIIVAATILLFLLLREFWTWYFKQTEIVKLLRRLVELEERKQKKRGTSGQPTSGEPTTSGEWKNTAGGQAASSTPPLETIGGGTRYGTCPKCGDDKLVPASPEQRKRGATACVECGHVFG